MVYGLDFGDGYSLSANDDSNERYGNGNFRTVIVAAATLDKGEKGTLSGFDKPIISAIELYAKDSEVNTSKRLSFKILSMLYGAVMLVDGGYESSDMAADNLRSAILSEL